MDGDRKEKKRKERKRNNNKSNRNFTYHIDDRRSFHICKQVIGTRLFKGQHQFKEEEEEEKRIEPNETRKDIRTNKDETGDDIR